MESFHFQVRFQTSANVNLRKRLVGWITLAWDEVADFSLMDSPTYIDMCGNQDSSDEGRNGMCV